MRLQYNILIIISFVFSLTLLNSCISPRCVVPNCQILVDHAHPIYGAEVAVGRSNKMKGRKGESFTRLEGIDERGGDMQYSGSTAQLYRGLPWYVFLFRKRHKPENPMLKGRYRHIDEREIQKHRNRSYSKRNVRMASKLNRNLLEQKAKTNAKREKRITDVQENLDKLDEKIAKLESSESKSKIYKDVIKAEDDWNDLKTTVAIIDSSGTRDGFLERLDIQAEQLAILKDDIERGEDDVFIVGAEGERIDSDKKRRDRKKKNKKKKEDSEESVPIIIDDEP